MRRTILAAVLGTLGLAASSQAAVIINDDFEYASQSAFQAAWPADPTTSETLSTTQAYSGTSSINLSTTAARNGQTFAETAATVAEPITFSFRFYDSNGTASAYRQYANIIDGPGTGTAGIIAMGLNNNIASNYYMARITAVDGGQGSSAFFKLDADTTKTRSTGWHLLSATIYPTYIDFYVDGGLAKTVNLPTAGQNKSYDKFQIGSNLSSTQQAFIDDVLVYTGAVPEPASLSLLAFGALPLLRRRSR